MGANSGISWTTHTFNPWWGCTKVSPGCANCYAEGTARRFGTPPKPDTHNGDRHLWPADLRVQELPVVTKW